jgi:hypothetical protein
MEAAGGRFDHWDLMLEHGGVLVTLELTQLPTAASTMIIRRLADHRLTYLDFEGHISGNRGEVVRLDRGRYEEVRSRDTSHDQHRFHYKLHGQHLTAIIGCDQPVFLVPFGMDVELEATEWSWRD